MLVKEKLSITMERKVVEKVDKLAEALDTSRSQVIENIVKDKFGMYSMFSEGMLRGGELEIDKL